MSASAPASAASRAVQAKVSVLWGQPATREPSSTLGPVLYSPPRRHADRVLFDIAKQKLEQFCAEHGLGIRSILSNDRRPSVARPRQAAYLYVYEESGAGRVILGRLFRRDPATVLHGMERERERERVSREVSSIANDLSIGAV